MEISKLEDNGNVIKEVSSSLSSTSSEFEKDVGSTHIMKKSSSMEAEECSKMVSQSSLDSKDTEIKSETEASGEIKQQDLKSTLHEIIYEIEQNMNGKEEHCLAQEKDKSKTTTDEELPLEENKEEIIQAAPEEYEIQTHKEIFHKIDRQTSTSSLEEQQRESNAGALLGLLSRDVGKRPHSLPANLAHIWQSLKIANELNQSLNAANTTLNGEDIEEAVDTEASGHKVNIEDGLHSKAIDLEKLFTPASDSGEITPSRSRKVFASSSFYAPNHPTMEEQVDLARRISHSLSDISNRESKGQSMYVNRKKRSVKWVHEGEGNAPEPEIENIRPSQKKESKPPLKLVMNPRGQVQDFTMLRKQGFVVDALTPMSPDVCFDLVRDLNAPKGKGAELFAKRRKRSENWIIDENNVKTPETTITQPPLNKLPPPSYLQGSTQRAENVQKMNEIQEKFSQPRLKLIKSPWEAALEGSVESAFQEVRQSPRGVLMAPTPTTLKRLATPPPPVTPIKEDLYKPKTPRAWNPQPTCKTFSSVKLDKIFAGSPRSPVSLAYHPETNTISTEPVIVENIPSIATQLTGYEVIEKSILNEPKTKRPDQFLIYEPVVSKTMPNTMKEEHAFVQNTNILSLAEEETNKTSMENEIKHASHTIEKKVKFKLNEGFQSSSAETSSEEVSEQFSSKYKEETNNGEIQVLTENGIRTNSNAHHLTNGNVSSEAVSMPSVPSCLSKISTVEETVLPIRVDLTVSKISQVTDESETIQKTENHFYNKLEMEHETKTADEEVEDLCEREFNALSLEYEKIQKPEVKKPAAQVVGAVPIFLGVDFSTIKKTEEPAGQIGKKSFRKPGSLVPGAKPLFGNAIGDIHVSMNESDGPDRPYEKIPVKNLISTFEQSTRPLIKYKQMQDKIPDAVSPNKFLNKEVQNKQTSDFENNMQQRTDTEQINFSVTDNITQNSNISEINVNSFAKERVEDNNDNMDEEEIQRIQHHYELQKHKKEIYDQQMQKYKEEMKQLRSKKTQLTKKSDESTTIMKEKQFFTSQSSDLNQTKFLNNGTCDGDQNNDILRNEDNAPKVSMTSCEPAVYTSTSQVSHFNYTGMNNYNTAPRGWQKSMAYYRPVTFNQSAPAYTDF